MYLQLSKNDEGAIEFYSSTNVTNEEQVIHFYYSLGK